MFTTYFLNNVMGNVFGTKKNPSLPSNYFIGLSSTAPTPNGDNVTEPNKTDGYNRVNLSNLTVPVGGKITNAGEISFSGSTGAWGTATHFVVFDAEEGGNLLMYDEMSEPQTIDSSTVVVIQAGDLELTLTGLA